MKEVSCRVFGTLFKPLTQRGLGVEALIANTGITVAHLRNKHERITWDEYLAVMENASTIWSDDELIDIGCAIFKNAFKPFGLVGRLLFTCRDFYRFLVVNTHQATGVGNQLFTCLNPHMEDRGESRLFVQLDMHPGYLPCRQFFLITKGCFMSAPTVLALPFADVHMDLSSNGAHYHIEYPKGGGVLARIRRAITWPLTARAVAQELREANEALTVRYSELQATQQVVDRQAKQLQTAHSISQAVHGNLDLRGMLDAVAKALVQIGGFSAASVTVAVHGEPDRIAGESSFGSPSSNEPIQRELATRGQHLGQLQMWLGREMSRAEAEELLERVLPVVTMAVDNAITYTTVVSYRKTLEKRVEERTTELRETVEQLKEAQAIRDRIFANINHEIRSPLSLIVLLVNELKGMTEGATPEIAERLEGINRASDNLLYLIDGLLLLASGQEGKLTLNVAPVELSELMREVAESYAPAARFAQVHLVVSAPQRAEVELDRLAIERALGNLVNNAIKFTPSGGTIQLDLQEGDSSVRLSVRDTGIGVDPAQAAALFERFTQDRNPVRSGTRGSGIGLAIVKEIADAHGGKVTASKNRDAGSTFTIELPRNLRSTNIKRGLVASTSSLHPGIAPLPIASSPVPTVTSANHDDQMEATVLVAEDDPSLLQSIVRLLSNHYRVLAAPDGLCALELTEHYRPDILVSDISMPGMDGLELSRRFREIKDNRMAPVILLTADSSRPTRMLGFESGAIDFVTKPFSPDELLARVAAQLSIRHLALRLLEHEKLAALGTLSAGLAHEIRNPANGIVNALRPLQQLIGPETLAKDGVRPLFNVVLDCAEQLAHLSHQLLGFLSPDRVKVTQEDPRTVVTQSLRLASSELGNITVETTFEYDGAIACARPLIVQALLNLIVNAAQACEPGGTITITTRKLGDDVIFEVLDSGPGIPLDLRERVFDPFFTTKPPGKGTGLGLPMARQVAINHGGTLTVHEGAKGALMRLQIPLTAAPPAVLGDARTTSVVEVG